MTSDAAAVALLRARGADTIEHPGGLLLAHLERVGARLAGWGASEPVRLAGLCHASYGTDGFPVALFPLTERAELAAVIGPAAEEVVYCYGSCDRAFSYPDVAERDGMFRDRFTGTEYVPALSLRRDFAEVTVANELDLVEIGPEFRAQHGAGLLRLCQRLRPLLSPPAWQDCVALLS